MPTSKKGEMITFDSTDVNKIRMFSDYVHQMNDAFIRNDFIIVNTRKVIFALNEMPVSDYKKEKIIRLLELLRNLSAKTFSIAVIEQIIKLDILHKVIERLLIYFTSPTFATYKYTKVILLCILGTLLNMTGISETMSLANIQYGLVDIAVNILEEGKFLTEAELNNQESLNLYNRLIGFLLSNSRWPIIKDKLIKMNIVSLLLKHKNDINVTLILLRYKQESKDNSDIQRRLNDLIKLKSDIIAILVRLVNDVELNQTDISDDIIHTLLDMLRQIIQESIDNVPKLNTKFYLTYTINSQVMNVFLDSVLHRLFKICVNDHVKQRLFELNGIGLIFNLVKSCSSYAEKRWSCELFCSLCFNENVCEILKNDEQVLKSIIEKYKSEKYIEIKIPCSQIMEMLNKTLNYRSRKYKSNDIIIRYSHYD